MVCDCSRAVDHGVRLLTRSRVDTHGHVASRGWTGGRLIERTPQGVYMDPTSPFHSLPPPSIWAQVVNQPLPFGDRGERNTGCIRTEIRIQKILIGRIRKY